MIIVKHARYKTIMIDESNFILKPKKTPGHFSKRFKATCDSCGKDRGYVDKSAADKLCRSCARTNVHALWSSEKKKEVGLKATRHFVGGKPWNKGQTGIYSEELKKQWSEKHTEQYKDPEMRKLAGSGPRRSWAKGKELPLDVKKKISCANRKISLEEFDEFKHVDKDHDRMKLVYLGLPKQCFERDNYTCARCNVHGVHLHAHHMNGFDKFLNERFNLDNLVTLCKICHKEFHETYGKGNNTKEQYLEFKISKDRKTVYLLTGAPASGKSWVVNQLKDRFDVVDADLVSKKMLISTVNSKDRPLLVLTVGVSTAVKQNPIWDVKLIVIQEDIEIINQRMLARGGKITNTIECRVKRMETLAKGALFVGTSNQVLEYLKAG